MIRPTLPTSMGPTAVAVKYSNMIGFVAAEDLVRFYSVCAHAQYITFLVGIEQNQIILDIKLYSKTRILQSISSFTTLE